MVSTVAIVTGAGSGIGRAVALRMAAAGHVVACLDIDKVAADNTAAQISQRRGTGVAYGCDVADDEQCRHAVDRAAQLGAVSVVCNIAGVAPPDSGVMSVTPDVWDRVLAVNVRSIYSMTRHAVPHMRRAGRGVVVNTSSVHAFAAQRNSAPYAASKGAVVALTRQLAVDLTQFRIRVVGIAPGAVDTPMGRAPEAVEGRTLAEVGFVKDPLALGRIGTAEETAAIFAWAASDDASFLNGTTVVVDAGLLSGLGTSRLPA